MRSYIGYLDILTSFIVAAAQIDRSSLWWLGTNIAIGICREGNLIWSTSLEVGVYLSIVARIGHVTFGVQDRIAIKIIEFNFLI